MTKRHLSSTYIQNKYRGFSNGVDSFLFNFNSKCIQNIFMKKSDYSSILLQGKGFSFFDTFTSMVYER